MEPPSHNALVAAMQRRQLQQLQTMQERPILVQTHKEDNWTPWQQAPAGAELWTRSVLLNEVLFDFDARPWSRVAEKVVAVVDALTGLGIPFQAGPSGGKGAHISVFLDPDSIKLPTGLLQAASRAGIDIWSIVRLTVAEAILDAADFPEGERWSPPVGSGMMDRLKVKWNALKRGSMVRLCGTPGSTGRRKTIVAPDYDWKGSANLPEPPTEPLQFHGKPDLFTVPPPIVTRIAEALEEAVKTAQVPTEVPTVIEANELRAIALFKSIPCIAKLLQDGAPSGMRDRAFGDFGIKAKMVGVPRWAADRLARQVLDKSPGADEGHALYRVASAYEGNYAPHLRCPSPLVPELCEGCQGTCPLAPKGFTFSG